MAEQQRHPALEFLYDVTVLVVVLGGLAILGAGLEESIG
jgi:hypothetical protein